MCESEKFFSMIKNGAEQMIESGCSVNETIEKVGAFLVSQGMDKEAVTTIQCGLKYELDAEFAKNYADYIYRKIRNEA